MSVPFLRWVGGKTRLLPALTKLLPQNYQNRRYVEPFLGGGALFFHLEPKEALLADLNRDLIRAYAAVRDHPGKLLSHLEVLSVEYARHKDAHYYAVRDSFNHGQDAMDWIQRAALFIYLNKCCFNGVWRVNQRGFFNVPIGEFKAGPNIVNTDVIHAACVALDTVDLLHGDFESLLSEAWEGDFIYLDPPYVPLSATSDFTTYNEGGFTFEDQKRLASVYRKLHERGCMLMLSNSSVPVVRELYKGFHFTEVMAPRSINSDTAGRGAIPELVIRNYESVQGRIHSAA